MVVIKLTDEQANALNVKNADDLRALLSEAETLRQEKAAAKQEEEFMKEELAALAARISTIEQKLEGLPAMVQATAEPQLKSIQDACVASAVAEVTKAIAKIGGQAIIAPAPADVGVQEPIAMPKDPKLAWESREDLQDIFPSAAAYAAYVKAEKNGHVRLFVSGKTKQ